jgi:hypothetical protein
MKKSRKTAPASRTETVPAVFAPSQEQIDVLARRLMPEIKRFFADEQIQQEFESWKEQRNVEE